MTTGQGVRAVIESKPIEPGTVERYLESKFGDVLPEARKAMAKLASAFEPDELAERGFSLYEQFRPEAAREAGRTVTYREIPSDYGHDAFLLEHEAQTPVIRSFLAEGDRYNPRRPHSGETPLTCPPPRPAASPALSPSQSSPPAS